MHSARTFAAAPSDVLRIEAAQQPGGHLCLAETAVDTHADAVHIQCDLRCMQGAFGQPARFSGADPNGGERRTPGEPARQFAAEGIADVDDDVLQVGCLEQPRLCGTVCGHGAVIVEMIAAQIGECG